jgi:hypothetical protein
VVLKLDLVRVAEFKNGCVLDFDLDDRNVLTLIVTFAGGSAILLDLEW